MSQTKQQRIFRAVALERLSSPEELDQLMQVSTSTGWLALLGVGLLLCAAITWSIFGKIPIKATGQGVLLRTEEIRQISAPVSGQVRAISVRVGDTVTSGQTVAHISRTDNGSTSDTPVVSADEGRVLEIRTTTGASVNLGSPILNIETSRPGQERATLEAVVYVPVVEGNKIRPDMRVEVWPETANRAESGFLWGRVVSVSAFPVNRQGLRQTLESDALAEQFLSLGPITEIRVQLEKAPDSASGYAWSTQAPDLTIENGALCAAQIIIERRRPLGLVLPIFEQLIDKVLDDD